MRIIWLIFFSLFCSVLFSQTLKQTSQEVYPANKIKNQEFIDSTTNLFQQADSIVSTLKGLQFEYVSDLADSLTSQFDNDLLKVRAIYKWVSDNIEYNCFSYHFKIFRTNDYHKVLQKRKAVCAGYASLFNELCFQSGIKSKIIEGYVSQNKIRKGHKKLVKHAWNIVWINNSWQFVDASWGAGYTNKRVTRFSAKFTDFFLFTQPELLRYTHFPKSSDWQLTDQAMSLNEFRSLPFIYYDFYNFKLIPESVNTFFIAAKASDTIQFKLAPVNQSFYLNHTISFYPDGLGHINASGNWEENIEFQFAPSFSGRKQVFILINGKPILSYYIRVR